jgi:hypothetical protein
MHDFPGPSADADRRPRARPRPRRRALPAAFACCAGAALLAGCEPPEGLGEEPAAAPLHPAQWEQSVREWERSVRWQTLADGSRFYSGENSQGVRRLVRCWGKEGAFDCLIATLDTSIVGTHLAVSRRSRARVSPRQAAEGEPRDEGYSCEITVGTVGDGFYETLSFASGDPVTNNVPSSRGARPWAPEAVAKLMKEKGVERGARYFRCEAFDRLVRAKGIDALADPATTVAAATGG